MEGAGKALLRLLTPLILLASALALPPSVLGVAVPQVSQRLLRVLRGESVRGLDGTGEILELAQVAEELEEDDGGEQLDASYKAGSVLSAAAGVGSAGETSPQFRLPTSATEAQLGHTERAGAHLSSEESHRRGDSTSLGQRSPGVKATRGGGQGSGRSSRAPFPFFSGPQAAGDAIDDEFVKLMVYHSSAIYVEDVIGLSAWNCSRCLLPPVRNFHLASLIIDHDALLQAYVGVQHEQGLVVVCFRGTHSTYLRNWIDDLWALELDLPYPGVQHALVHKGFYSAYHKTQLRPQVSVQALRLLAAHPEYQLAVTGHSLGAALASLCSLDLVVTFHVPSDRVRLATFGSPRVGNSVFAEFFRSTLPLSVRVTHGRDIVVHLPPHTPNSGMLAYHHVARELWYHRPSPFSREEVCRACDDSGEDASCSRSLPGSSILDHLTYLGVSLCNVPSWPQVSEGSGGLVGTS